MCVINSKMRQCYMPKIITINPCVTKLQFAKFGTILFQDTAYSVSVVRYPRVIRYGFKRPINEPSAYRATYTITVLGCVNTGAIKYQAEGASCHDG